MSNGENHEPREFAIDIKKLVRATPQELEKTIGVLDEEIKQAKAKKEKVSRILSKKRTRDRERRQEEVSVDTGDVGLPPVPAMLSSRGALGDINFVLAEVNLTFPEVGDIIMQIAEELIQKTKGLMPRMEIHFYREGRNKDERIRAYWKMPRLLTDKELKRGIMKICREAFGKSIRGFHENGSAESTFTGLNAKNKLDPRKKGVYFGPQPNYEHLATGIKVLRSFSTGSRARYVLSAYAHPADWLTAEIEGGKKETEIEFLDGYYDDKNTGLAQDDWLGAVVQISYLLAHGTFIPEEQLMSAIYRALGKVGAADPETDKLHSLQDIFRLIQKRFLLPLQRPSLMQTQRIEPQSMLFAGSAGTGKTETAKWLLNGEYNAIFVAVDGNKLHSELKKDEPSKTLMRVDKIRRRTRLPVVLTLDDLDVLAHRGERDMTSKLLNALQGLSEKKFYLIATSNTPWDIDPRMFQPGRIGRIVYFGLPSRADREGILARYLQEYVAFKTPEEKEKIIRTMAQKTEGWSPRFLKQLCLDAVLESAWEQYDSTLFSLDFYSDGKDGSNPSSLLLEERHFASAFNELEGGINVREIKETDERIQEFVRHTNKVAGLIRTNNA